jgi:ankyrin repeat protein
MISSYHHLATTTFLATTHHQLCRHDFLSRHTATSHQARCNEPDNYGYTPLRLAVEFGYLLILLTLLILPTLSNCPPLLLTLATLLPVLDHEA